jgi:hypothetical protein
MDKTILTSELKSARDILTKWVDKLEKEGVPVTDFDATTEESVDWIRNLCGEVGLVAGKIDAITASILGER